jgi:hypothetical protein
MWRDRSSNPHAIEVVAWPDDANKPIPRKPMVAKSKLAAEGGLAKTKVILGWHFNSCTLTKTLSKHKYTAWSNKIKKMIDKKKTLRKTVGLTIGWMRHAAFLVPWVFHFLSRLWSLFAWAHNRRFILIKEMSRKDLELMLLILKKVKHGIDINLLALWLPDWVYYSDSCPTGLGGHSNQGHAWRFKVPNDLQFHVTNNLLKFIASMIMPWMDIIKSRLNQRGLRSVDDQQHDRGGMVATIQLGWAEWQHLPKQWLMSVLVTKLTNFHYQ